MSVNIHIPGLIRNEKMCRFAFLKNSIFLAMQHDTAVMQN